MSKAAVGVGLIDLKNAFCGILRFVIRKKCRFCGCRDAKALCDWPTTRRGEVRVDDLRVGDIWVTQLSDKGKSGKIVEIEDFDLTRRFWILIPGHRNASPYDRFRGELQMSERNTTCDNACCFRHRRRIGPDRHYCADHWSAWEAVS
jgi:hypothetical protein